MRAKCGREGHAKPPQTSHDRPAPVATSDWFGEPLRFVLTSPHSPPGNTYLGLNLWRRPPLFGVPPAPGGKPTPKRIAKSRGNEQPDGPDNLIQAADWPHKSGHKNFGFSQGPFKPCHCAPKSPALSDSYGSWKFPSEGLRAPNMVKGGTSGNSKPFGYLYMLQGGTPNMWNYL